MKSHLTVELINTTVTDLHIIQCHFLNFEEKAHFPNNPKKPDPSSKMDLDFWDCLGSEKPSYSKNN